VKAIKCGWCGQQVELGANTRVQPHRNGAQQCPGSGQPRIQHDQLTGAGMALFNVYQGRVYQGTIPAKNKLHAVSMWAKQVRQDQSLFRADEVKEKDQ
jgi:hypothetical protein